MNGAERPVFGRLLRRLRKDRGLTQLALAQQVTYAVDTIKKLEQGLRSPSPQLVASLADGLGLAGAERAALFAAVNGAPDVAADPTPALPLPTLLTPLIGRTAELEQLVALFGDPSVRLVTILGPGGMGKTHLAIELAHTLAPALRDGVAFVALAALPGGTSPARAIAEAVQLPPQPDSRNETQQLLDYLRPRRLVLLLDNFEPLLPAGADLVRDLLQQCPQLRLLITSRERLQLSSETVFTLKSLAFPTWEGAPDTADYGAVQLFVAMARRARPDLQLAPRDQQLVARICRLVAGMPLGLILAASWADVLSIEAIAAELLSGQQLLHAELRDLPARQRSMHAVINASWQRLAADEQAGFARLAVFRGGFRRDAAGAIADLSLPILTRLVHASFVQPQGDRYELHELLRQFGDSHLRHDERYRQLRDRHSRFYLALLHDCAKLLTGARQLDAIATLRDERENIRVAWQRAIEQQDDEAIAAALDGLFGWFWLDRGQQEYAIGLLQAAQTAWAQLPGARATRLRARLAARVLPRDGPWIADDVMVVEQLQWAQAQAHASALEAAFCAWALGFVWMSRGMRIDHAHLAAAVDAFQQSLQLYRQAGGHPWEAQVLEHLGHCYRAQDRYDEAIARRALSLYTSIHVHDTIWTWTRERSAPMTEQAAPHDQSANIVYTAEATSFLAQRRATTHAAFFLPHLQPGMRVLDIGCGPGSITSDFAATVQPGEVIGIDIDPAHIARARADAAPHQAANLRFDIGDANALPFPDHSFDAVFLHGVVEYIADPVAVFTEVRRVLRTGGVMGARHGDWGGFLLAPAQADVRQFFALFQQLMTHHGGDPYCGRNQLAAIRQAGFARTLVSASYDCWTATPRATQEVAQFFASYCTSAAFAEPVVQLGWVDQARLEAISAALRQWADHQAAFAAEAWGEVIAWKE